MMYNQKKTKSVVLPWTIFSSDHQSIAYSYFESYLIYIGCIILALKSAISTLLIWGCDGLRGLRAQQKISYSFCPPPLVHCYQKIRSWFPYVLLLKRGGYILQHSLFGRSLVCQWWLYHIGSTRFGWSEQPLYCWWHIYDGDAIVALNTDMLFSLRRISQRKAFTSRKFITLMSHYSPLCATSSRGLCYVDSQVWEPLWLCRIRGYRRIKIDRWSIPDISS